MSVPAEDLARAGPEACLLSDAHMGNTPCHRADAMERIDVDSCSAMWLSIAFVDCDTRDMKLWGDQAQARAVRSPVRSSAVSSFGTRDPSAPLPTTTCRNGVVPGTRFQPNAARSYRLSSFRE
jgi:hypothetical protein